MLKAENPITNNPKLNKLTLETKVFTAEINCFTLKFMFLKHNTINLYK